MWTGKYLVVLLSFVVFQVAAHSDDDYYEYTCPEGEILNECATYDECDGEYCRETQLDPTPADCPAADPDDCYYRCMCKPGQLRNESGYCVLISQCPPFQCTGQYEEYVASPRACPDETCEQATVSPARCMLHPRNPVPREPACRCIAGYFRDNDYDCVPFEKCPPHECPLGEYLNTCPAQSCEGMLCPLSPSSPLSCPATTECGTPQCTCNFNTRRSRLTGECVPLKKCPKFKCDGQNEEYQACPPECPGETCTDYLNNATCPRFRIGIAKECRPQCRCKEGFYRNFTGVCVAASECKTSGSNWFLNPQKGCGVPCGETYMLHIDSHLPSPRICHPNVGDDKLGYVLNEASEKCPAGETWSDCAPEQCSAEYCPTRDVTDVIVMCATSQPCVGRCVCGFQQRRRVTDGTCIPATQCPAYECSKPNESYRTCQRCEKCSYIRASGECSVLPFGVSKIVVPCVPKCYCKEGYYRNDAGHCIPKNECRQSFSGCNGDPNAKSGCGNHCGRTCKLHDKGSVACPEICKVGGCDCNKGYVLNEGTRKCVLPTECPIAVVVAAATQDDLKKFSLSSFDFSIKLFRQLSNANINRSVVCSSLSLETLLANIALGAVGETKEQLQTTIGIQNDDYSKSVFPNIISNLLATEGVNLSFASGYFVDEDFKLNATFKRDSSKYFKAAIENVNFNESSTVDYLNSWVAKNTQNKITKLFNDNSFNVFTRLVMCNAIYFKGEWKTQFDEKNTKDQDFHVSNSKTIQIKTMYVESTFNYFESQELKAQLLELVYKGGKASMVIALPYDKEGLNALLENINSNIWHNETNKMSNRIVQVRLPKWNTETMSDFGNMLKNIGIINIFRKSNSGLNNIVETKKPLYVSQVVQKAVINVNEKGAVAAAATGITIRANRPGLPPPPPLRFTADHPFLYHIKADGIVIFSGCFVSP